MQDSPPPDFQESWDSIYRTRKRLYGGSPPLIPEIGPGSVVLEVGCGDGKGLSGMIDRGWHIHATDFSPAAVQLCRSHPLYREVSYTIADASLLPFRSGTFDAVILSHVLGHGRTKQRTMIAGEGIRVLKSGGKIFFRDFSEHDFRAKKAVSATRVDASGILNHYFTIREVLDIFPGLTQVSINEVRWLMGGKKGRFERAEIVAVFKKI